MLQTLPVKALAGLVSCILAVIIAMSASAQDDLLTKVKKMEMNSANPAPSNPSLVPQRFQNLLDKRIHFDPESPKPVAPFPQNDQSLLLQTPVGEKEEVPTLIKQTLDELEAKKKAVVLKARVEHEEHLPPVPDGYRTGHAIDVKELQAAKGGNFWRKIPKELGGTWVSEDNMIFRQKDLKDLTINGTQILKAGQEDMKFHRHLAYKQKVVGFQLDSEGNEWTYEGGLTEAIKSPNAVTFDTDTRRDVYYESPDTVIDRITATRLTVSGNKVGKAVQLEQLNTINLISPGVQRVDASLKLYDENGDPLSEAQGSRVWHRVAPFHVIDNYQGHDMRALFKEYLTSQNMAQLVPRD